MSKEQKSIKLIQEAQLLIKPNAFDNNGGISSVSNKSQNELANNKKGFNKLIKASKLNIHWIAHFNLAEFYFSGLDGATKINKLQSGYHYIQAWKLTNNKMTKLTESCVQFEQLLFNFCGVLENINFTKKQYVDSNEIIKLSKCLHKHSKFVSYKIFGHFIHGLILNRLSKRAKSYIQFQKCVQQKNNRKLSYYAEYAVINAKKMLHTMDITNKALNEQQKQNNQQFVRKDPRYSQGHQYFDKETQKLNAEYVGETTKMSGVNTSTINEVIVTRTIHENNQNSLVTIDKSLNIVTVDSGNSAERKCTFCGKLGLNMKRCSRCKQAHYCSIQCQKPDWKNHKKYCKK